MLLNIIAKAEALAKANRAPKTRRQRPAASFIPTGGIIIRSASVTKKPLGKGVQNLARKMKKTAQAAAKLQGQQTWSQIKTIEGLTPAQRKGLLEEVVSTSQKLVASQVDFLQEAYDRLHGVGFITLRGSQKAKEAAEVEKANRKFSKSAVQAAARKANNAGVLVTRATFNTDGGEAAKAQIVAKAFEKAAAKKAAKVAKAEEGVAKATAKVDKANKKAERTFYAAEKALKTFNEAEIKLSYLYEEQEEEIKAAEATLAQAEEDLKEAEEVAHEAHLAANAAYDELVEAEAALEDAKLTRKQRLARALGVDVADLTKADIRAFGKLRKKEARKPKVSKPVAYPGNIYPEGYAKVFAAAALVRKPSKGAHATGLKGKQHRKSTVKSAKQVIK